MHENNKRFKDLNQTDEMFSMIKKVHENKLMEDLSVSKEGYGSFIAQTPKYEKKLAKVRALRIEAGELSFKDAAPIHMECVCLTLAALYDMEYTGSIKKMKVPIKFYLARLDSLVSHMNFVYNNALKYEMNELRSIIAFALYVSISNQIFHEVALLENKIIENTLFCKRIINLKNLSKSCALNRFRIVTFDMLERELRDLLSRNNKLY